MRELLNISASAIIGLFIGFMLLLGYFFFKGVSIAKKENKIPKNKSGK